MLVKSQVKYIQSLGHKKFRDEEGVFVAEGSKIVLELLRSHGESLVVLYATTDWLKENESVIPSGKTAVGLEKHELERISFLSAPGRVLALFHKPVFPVLEKPKGVILLLDNIQDPGNLGTIVRTADWFGVKQIVCTPDTADVFNPKVVQATMGSISRVHVMYRHLKEYMQTHAGIPSYAAALDGEDLEEIRRMPEGFILLGNESRGIQNELAALADHRIRIPGSGNAESLNVAVAAGILLFMIRN